MKLSAVATDVALLSFNPCCVLRLPLCIAVQLVNRVVLLHSIDGYSAFLAVPSNVRSGLIFVPSNKVPIVRRAGTALSAESFLPTEVGVPVEGILTAGTGDARFGVRGGDQLLQPASFYYQGSPTELCPRS